MSFRTKRHLSALFLLLAAWIFIAAFCRPSHAMDGVTPPKQSTATWPWANMPSMRVAWNMPGGASNPGPGNSSSEVWPTLSDLQYAAGKGVTMIRLAIDPARLCTNCPSSSPTISSAEVSSINTVINNAKSLNMWVELDMHPGGGLQFYDPAGSNYDAPVNVSGSVWTTTMFADFWAAVAPNFTQYNVVFHLMNEPCGTLCNGQSGCPHGTTCGQQTPAAWASAAQAAVAAIRNSSSTAKKQWISIPIGGAYGGACSWANTGSDSSTNSSAWSGYSDPAGSGAPWFFEVHWYPNSTCNDNAAGPTVDGNVCAINGNSSPDDNITSITSWLLSNHWYGWFGEYAWGENTTTGLVSPECIPAGTQFLSYIAGNHPWLGAAWWMYAPSWGTGAGYSNLNPGTQNTGDQNLITTLPWKQFAQPRGDGAPSWPPPF
jgi:Cellulase (glycosyl hydrolase family 5)